MAPLVDLQRLVSVDEEAANPLPPAAAAGLRHLGRARVVPHDVVGQLRDEHGHVPATEGGVELLDKLDVLLSVIGFSLSMADPDARPIRKGK